MKQTYFSLNQAAKEAGKSTSTISKYLKNGKLSYVSKDESGYKIDPAELFRVFPKKKVESVHETPNRTNANTQKNTIEYIQLQAERDVLDEKLKMKEERIEELGNKVEDLQNERNEWRSQAQQSIRLLEDSRSKQAETLPKMDYATQGLIIILLLLVFAIGYLGMSSL